MPQAFLHHETNFDEIHLSLDPAPTDFRNRNEADLHLKQVLSQCMDDSIPVNEWKISRNSMGKPIIQNSLRTSPPYFSLSYSRGLNAIALSRSTPVGVDIEEIPREPIASEISIAFSDIEKEQLRALPSTEASRAAIKLWTAKEALSKLLGIGAEMDFDRVTFSLAPLKIIHTSLDFDFTDIELFDVLLSGTHQLTLAVKNYPQHKSNLRISARTLSL